MPDSETQSELLEELRRLKSRVAELEERRGGDTRHDASAGHDLLTHIVEGTGDAVFVKDERGCYLLVNSASVRVMGRPVAEVLGRDDSELFPPSVARDLMATDARVIRHGEEITKEEDVQTPGSDRRTFLSIKFPYRNERGEIVGVIGIARDITERKRAEEARERSKKLLEAIHRVQSRYIAGGDVGQFFDDLLNVLLQVTESEYGFIGEVLKKDGKPYLKTHSITDISWNEATREFYANNAPQGLEFFNLETLFGAVLTSGGPVMTNDPRSDPRSSGIPGGHPPLDAFLGMPFHQSGRMVGMVGIANRRGGYNEEIAGFLAPFLSTCAALIVAHRGEVLRREAEAKLREQESHLAHVTRLSTTGEMVAEIAHEVSQPLYSITCFAKACAERLESGDVDREVLLGWTQRIRDIAQQGGEMLGRFSSFVRKSDETWSSVDLHQTIADSIALVDFEARRHAVGIAFEPREVPVWVEVDRTRIQQVLVNLLKNACEAMKSCDETNSRVFVRVRPAGDKVEVVVEDAGVGLPEEQPDRVFHPFYTTKADGMGMGLSVSRTIVEEHGGELWARPNPAGGASFGFTLPLAPDSPA